MACPFSTPLRVASVDSSSDGTARPGMSDERSESHSRAEQPWDRGPSLDGPPRHDMTSGAGDSLGGGSPRMSVQQRVSSYTRMTRSPSAPAAVARRGVRRGSGTSLDADGPIVVSNRKRWGPDDPLSIHALTEAVWSFVTTPADLLLMTLDAFLLQGDQEWRTLRRKLRIVADSVCEWDDWHLDDLLSTLSKQLEVNSEEFLSRLGQEYVRQCRAFYGSALESLGNDLQGFLSNLTSICDIIRDNIGEGGSVGSVSVGGGGGGESGFGGGAMINTLAKFRDEGPTLLCNRQGESVLFHYHTNRELIRYFMSGVIEGVAVQLFGRWVKVSSTKGSVTSNGTRNRHRYYFLYTIRDNGRATLAQDASSPSSSSANSTIRQELDELEGEEIQQASANVHDFNIGVESFCHAFPWHFVCSKDMRFTQLGTGLLQVFSSSAVKDGAEVGSCFGLVYPEDTDLTYDQIVAKINSSFVLIIKHQQSSRLKMKNMELKGQMVECPESDSLLFVGSPLLKGMEDLTSRGLFLSDIPIHDATRDVILVGEQSRAQDGLKRRMAHLKDSIEATNRAVGEEREKNVSLLHLIFPPNIAKRLWLGETIEAQTHEEVTMLFSDIVGFTSICATATPIMVINMLQNLYTQFDSFCGQLDVYKVETIGDAYCVAGNLHRRSEWHAQLVAWMALKMMYSCTSHHTHDGKPIQMRIGLHTGNVLAGVVGTAMPRYCMFGANVTIANQFESGSEPLKINISPTTHRHLAATPGWSFTPRSRDCLPKSFPQDIPGTPHFLDSYHHPDVDKNLPLPAHVNEALSLLEVDKS
ncbi:guanylate cyclase 1 soluble subunit alpha 2 [Oratosquilla oratoria]|uniref:guanylate cyclase 1 soluble subunit alpha 2 n=1 Tax=Oratosquilla oratoria TaxID=337810 RepID=UPI003F75E168